MTHEEASNLLVKHWEAILKWARFKAYGDMELAQDLRSKVAVEVLRIASKMPVEFFAQKVQLLLAREMHDIRRAAPRARAGQRKMTHLPTAFAPVDGFRFVCQKEAAAALERLSPCQRRDVTSFYAMGQGGWTSNAGHGLKRLRKELGDGL